MKKQGLGTVFVILSVLAALAGTVIYYINATGTYYGDFGVKIVAVSVSGIVVLIALKVLAAKNGEKQWMDIFYPVAAVLMAIAAVWFIGARVESAAIILGSELEAGNQIARNSLFLAFVGIGCYIAGMLLAGVAGFFNLQKQKTEQTEQVQ